MTDTGHDPMCCAQDEWEVFDNTDGHRSIRMKCFCSLIRAVRAECAATATSVIDAIREQHDADLAEQKRTYERLLSEQRGDLVGEAIRRVEGLPVVSSGIGMKDDALAALAAMKET